MKKKVFTLLTLLVLCVTGAWASTVSDLVSITSAETFTLKGINGTSALVDGTLYSSGKLLSLGGSGYDAKSDVTYNDVKYTPVYQIKNSRQIALKIGFFAKITVVGTKNSSRKWRIGTTSAGAEIVDGANNSISASGIVDGSITEQIVYINASSDLYLGAIIIEAAPVQSPTFSLTKTTINTLETSQIQLWNMGSMNGISFDGDVTFGTAGVVTVNASGVVTPVAPGTTTINFNTNAVSGKFNASTGNSVTITVTEPVVATPTFTVYGNKVVKISCATDGYDKIYYGGSDIKSGGTKTEYTGMFIPAANGKIYAYATKDGYADSELGEVTVTFPVVGDVIGDKIFTMQPETAPGSDATFDSKTHTRGGYTLVSSNNLKYSHYDGFSNNYKSNGTFTLTAPSTSTIKSIKVVGIRNNDSGDATVTAAAEGNLTLVSSVGTLIRRGVVISGDLVISEVVLKVDDLAQTAGNTVKFTIDNESRFFVEIYGSATKEIIKTSKEYTTYVPTQDLDFSSTDKLTAYIATGANASNVTMVAVDKVPAGTPVVLKSTDTANNIEVNIATTTDDVSDNKLMVGDGITSIGGDGKWDYILSNGKFYHASAGVLPAGKCYLHLDAEPAANELTMDFGDGDVTGIKNLTPALSKGEGAVYDLQGRLVAQPTKGLYIMNGKKVVLK